MILPQDLSLGLMWIMTVRTSSHPHTVANCCFALIMAVEAGVEYPLVLGTTVLDAEAPCNYLPMRYDFRPASAAGRHASGTFSQRQQQVCHPPPPPSSRGEFPAHNPPTDRSFTR